VFFECFRCILRTGRMMPARRRKYRRDKNLIDFYQKNKYIFRVEVLHFILSAIKPRVYLISTSSSLKLSFLYDSYDVCVSEKSIFRKIFLLIAVSMSSVLLSLYDSLKSLLIRFLSCDFLIFFLTIKNRLLPESRKNHCLC
jgi:hypothetical protein